ncbi:MAG: hypothetical protein J5J06_04360 [Phycisphaerae bacterium]|nr:hypothetical protein [Phycisphaerae bacterium]
MIPQARVAGAVETMSAPAGTARFAAGKGLCITAEKDPIRVYPHFEVIASLLESDSKIVRWNAMRILAELAPVDQRRKLDKCLSFYLAFVRCGNLISAANAVGCLGKIVCNRPDLLERVLPAFLEVERLDYETPECRNVALGQVLDALVLFGPDVLARPDVSGFVRRLTSNSRAAVARKARKIAMP